jgi:hypothetical protein
MADKKIDLSKRYWSPIREEKKKLFAMRTEKYCNWCGQFHPIEAFYQPSASGLTGISAYCKDGTRAYQRQRYYERRARRESAGLMKRR